MKKIFENQEFLMDNVYHIARDKDSIIGAYRTATLAAVDELMESLRCTPWKPWSKQESWDWDELHGELVDVFSFFVELCILAGLSPENLEKMYFDKSKVNIARQASGTYGLNDPVSKLTRVQLDALFQEARLGECTTDRVGCMIVPEEGEPVFGHNWAVDGVPCNHRPEDGCPGRTVHAEVAALLAALRERVDVKGATAFVTSDPCDRCVASLKATGVDAVWRV